MTNLYIDISNHYDQPIANTFISRAFARLFHMTFGVYLNVSMYVCVSRKHITEYYWTDPNATSHGYSGTSCVVLVINKYYIGQRSRSRSPSTRKPLFEP